MLTYFLITWVVAFFAFCLPLLFITEKEKEEERNRSKGYGDIGPKNPKARFVVNSTRILNWIFLFILPYIISIEFNFTNFQLLCGYLITIIFTFIVLPVLNGSALNNIRSDLGKLIYNLTELFIRPGGYLVDLTFK